MIQVKLYHNRDKKYIGFQLRGHAGFGEEGQDIVCAAVSVLAINTINAVEAYTKDKISVLSDEEEGCIVCRFQTNPSKEAELLLKTMVLGLKQITDNDDYAEYIQLNFEEV